MRERSAPLSRTAVASCEPTRTSQRKTGSAETADVKISAVRSRSEFSGSEHDREQKLSPAVDVLSSFSGAGLDSVT